METRNKVEGYIQQSKDDWWDCIYCLDKQHRGFPYDCPDVEARAKRFIKYMERVKNGK